MKTERVHFWQGFSVALALVLAAVAADSRHSIAAQSGRQRFSEIDVERINIVEADGTVKLVIANRERAPDQVTDGQSRPRAAANKSPGITFFDDAGDEAGGLKIRGDRRAGPSAERHLMFDQQRGDYAIELMSDENATGRTAGMAVFDRPDVPLLDVGARFAQIQSMPAGAERTRLIAEFEACCAGFGAQRVFVGKNRGKDARVSLADARGRERLRLVVTAQGDARMEFVDERGSVVSTWPERR
ncbi:MAG TPA: hypothetical protein VJP86_13630 [Vicinamibacterales bacterium]|jgi:hypothetical protein|nr:hypothetical protein [Vicinamibacterales bacterium]